MPQWVCLKCGRIQEDNAQLFADQTTCIKCGRRRIELLNTKEADSR